MAFEKHLGDDFESDKVNQIFELIDVNDDKSIEYTEFLMASVS